MAVSGLSAAVLEVLNEVKQSQAASGPDSVDRLLDKLFELSGRLGEAEERFRSAFEEAPIGMAILDSDRQIVRVNRAFSDMLGYSEAELIGEPLSGITEVRGAGSDRAVLRLLSRERTKAASEWRFRHKDGRAIWASVSTSPFRDPGRTGPAFLVQLQDVTERRRLMRALEQRALHDSLTGLPNRALLMDRLRQALSGAARSARPVVLLFIDLDRFKVFNDSLGHRVADQLLIAVGNRLTQALRPEDTVARLYGDEFVVLCEGVDDGREITSMASRVHAVFEKPFHPLGKEIYVNGSVGVAIGQPGDDPEEVLSQADTAMYKAKAEGRGGYEFFSEGLRRRALERLQLEEALLRAVERDELSLLYQPLVELATGRVVGIEALLRWRQPDGGVVGPEAFIAVAEETGAIAEVGAWALRAAAHQAALWNRGGDAPRVWINISGRQLRQRQLVAALTEAMNDIEGFDPGQIGFEVAERSLMEVAEVASGVLPEIRRLGVMVAVDDFGTSRCSLSCLRDLAVSALKIDRSFIARLGQDEGALALVRAMVAMGTALGLDVVAEGVETEAAAELLREMGCRFGQGSRLGEPMSAEELEVAWLQLPAG